jgi:16S rRNA (cytidine1402-2'-O)-methyltransferase
MKKGKLWLIPSPLGENVLFRSLSSETITIIQGLSAFIVENEKVSRKFLREAGIKVPQNELILEEYGKHDRKPLGEYFKVLENGQDMGLLSDAGCPGIADPGSEIVLEAHRRGIQVIPLIGPSSIILSLMASGLNGQSFTFHGYLPIERKARKEKLRTLEIQSEKLDQTQIFIETPYRNLAIIQEVLETLKPGTKFCIAAGLSTDQEFVQTRTLAEWKKNPPLLDKIPAIYLLYKGY